MKFVLFHFIGPFGTGFCNSSGCGAKKGEERV